MFLTLAPPPPPLHPKNGSTPLYYCRAYMISYALIQDSFHNYFMTLIVYPIRSEAIGRSVLENLDIFIPQSRQI